MHLLSLIYDALSSRPLSSTEKAEVKHILPELFAEMLAAMSANENAKIDTTQIKAKLNQRCQLGLAMVDFKVSLQFVVLSNESL